MSKQLKEVHHLYLGARCVILGIVEQKEIMMVSAMSVCTGMDYKNRPIWRNVWDVKPILRRLESMTEEEAKEYLTKGLYNFDTATIQAVDNDGIDYEYGNTEMRSEFWNTSAHEFHWLLSKHFDLFGLIDSNQAIDAATLPA